MRISLNSQQAMEAGQVFILVLAMYLGQMADKWSTPKKHRNPRLTKSGKGS